MTVYYLKEDGPLSQFYEDCCLVGCDASDVSDVHRSLFDPENGGSAKLQAWRHIAEDVIYSQRPEELKPHTSPLKFIFSYSFLELYCV